VGGGAWQAGAGKPTLMRRVSSRIKLEPIAEVRGEATLCFCSPYGLC
jgi:hypothetical protein